jgi:ABC-type molybdate transport system substrate-binding protein
VKVFIADLKKKSQVLPIMACKSMVLGVFAFHLVFFARHAHADGATALTVLTPTVLTEAMVAVTKAYARQEDISVSLVFGSAEEQTERIVEGQPADLLLTDDLEVIKNLRNRGLLDVYEQTALYPLPMLIVASRPHPTFLVDEKPTDKVVPVAPYSEDQQLPWLSGGYGDGQHALESTPEELLARRAKMVETYKTLRRWLKTRPLVMPDPWKTALGREAADLMHQLFVPANMDSQLMMVTDSRTVLRQLQNKPALGVVFAHDYEHYISTSAKEGLDIVATPPPSLYRVPIVYLAVVAGEYMPDARKLADFIRSEEGQAIFQRYGLVK